MEIKKESGLLAKMQSVDTKAFEHFYETCRRDFLHWARRRFPGFQNDLEDIFQDAILLFYEKVKTGKLTKLESSPKTFVFGIARHLLLKNYYKQRRIILVDEMENTVLAGEEPEIMLQFDQEHKEYLFQNAYHRLSEVCQKFFLLFFFENRTIGQVKKDLDYGSKAVVRTQKARCLEKMKKNILQVLVEMRKEARYW